ncbi:MAG TPA: MraY family glycosyltransferase [Solirubrobacteraceae bacterium]|nr:MraY family glycosyltransferase [Solirubrobacteraceae bacterium]
MPLELRLLIGLALSTAMVYATTPLAIRVAARLDFYDKPRGYRGHAHPTPYLGGAAVVAGFAVVVLLLTREPSQTLPVLGGVLVLWAVGTIDDRRDVAPLQRVAVEVALAAILWAVGLGWSLGLGGIPDLIATVVWVVAVVNAFNLFDNMDGASSTMALVVSGAIAVLGAVQSDVWLAVTAAALCGACLGFLPHNLSRPSARIFLGDGGSMPIGFAVAALVMIGASSAAAQWQALVMGLLLVGVPALDTCLVVVSRRRRGISILTGGRDHLTHRTRERVRTAHGVAAALGSAQAVLAALALVAVTGGSALLVPAVLLYLVLMATVIVVLDSSARFASPVAPAAASPAASDGTRRKLQLPSTRARMYGLFVLVPFGIALGLSPFWSGYYDSSIWVPAALGLLVVLTACLIARPVRLPRLTVVSLAGIAALALWGLASALWTDSIEGAFVEGNRMLLYAAALGLLVVLVLDDRRAEWLFGAVVAGALAVGAWVVVGLLRGDPSLFLDGRLHEPLEYINGQASFFVLALWPCLALAESRRSAVAGSALGAATLFASLVVLGQSRGAVLAALVSLLVVAAVLPGRVRRLTALMVAAACLLPALPTLLDVYRLQTPAALEQAGRAVLLCSVAAAVLWALLVYAAQRVTASGGDAARRLQRAFAAATMALALVAAVAGIASAPRIADFSERQYRAFVTLGGQQGGEPSASRLATGAGNRYDYWRIAVHAWRGDPVVGVGAGGYDKPYFVERATTEDIRQPHSLPLQVLAELGVVGMLLLLGIAVAIAAGAWRRIARVRALRGPPSPVLVAAVGVLTAWLVHTSVDWIHLLPGLTGIALIAVAVLLHPGDERAAAAVPRFDLRLPRLARIFPAVAVGVAISIAAVSLSRQGLSERYVTRAQNAVSDRPAVALREANRALRLDAESIPAYYAKAAAIARFGDGQAAQETLHEAARREPRNFVTWTLLGDLSVRRQDPAAARRYYRRAAELNPRNAELARLAQEPG